jgi:uncharacterized membrane protein YfcA
MHDIVREPIARGYRWHLWAASLVVLTGVACVCVWLIPVQLSWPAWSPAASVILVAVALTSFLSGLFGASGGTILIGLLLVVLDVGTAMIVYSLAQITSTIGRAALWRREIVWPLVTRYLVGAAIAVGIMRLIAYIPDKAVIYICLGMMPFAVAMFPRRMAPDISRGLGAYICGMLVTGLQIVAGSGGVTLDLFFQKSNLTRKAVVATKAALQTSTQFLRMAYFGSLATAFAITLPWYVGLAIVAVSIAGTAVAGLALQKMTDTEFRLWGTRIVMAVAILFLARGLWLIFQG